MSNQTNSKNILEDEVLEVLRQATTLGFLLRGLFLFVLSAHPFYKRLIELSPKISAMGYMDVDKPQFLTVK